MEKMNFFANGKVNISGWNPMKVSKFETKRITEYQLINVSRSIETIETLINPKELEILEFEK